jgi:hypothetical protein
MDTRYGDLMVMNLCEGAREWEIEAEVQSLRN